MYRTGTVRYAATHITGKGLLMLYWTHCHDIRFNEERKQNGAETVPEYFSLVKFYLEEDLEEDHVHVSHGTKQLGESFLNTNLLYKPSSRF